MSDEEGLRGRVTRQSEEAIGKLAQELLENPMISSALSTAFETRERAMRAQEVAMGALNLPSASDLERLTRRMLKDYARLRRWEQTGDVLQNALLRLHRALASERPRSVRAFLALAATQIRRELIDLSRHHFGPEGQAAHRLRGVHGAHAGLLCGALAGVHVEPAAGKRGAGEHQREHRREPGQLGGDAHAATDWPW